MRWALLLALVSTSALASRADRLSVSPRLDRRDRLGAASPDTVFFAFTDPGNECSGAAIPGLTLSRAGTQPCATAGMTSVMVGVDQPAIEPDGLAWSPLISPRQYISVASPLRVSETRVYGVTVTPWGSALNVGTYALFHHGNGAYNSNNSVTVYVTEQGILGTQERDAAGQAQGWRSAAGTITHGPHHIRLQIEPTGAPLLHVDGVAVPMTLTSGVAVDRAAPVGGGIHVGGIPSSGQFPFRGRMRDLCVSRDPSACVGAEPLQRSGVHILALGDSITSGGAIWAVSSVDHPRRTQWLYGYGENVAVNAGSSGYETSQVLSRWTSDGKGRGFDVLVLLAGINDISRDLPTVDAFANIAQIVDEASGEGATVVMSTVFPYGVLTAPQQAELESLNTLIRNYATSEGHVLVDGYVLMGDPNDPTALNPLYNAGDSLHINEAGNIVFAQVVYDALNPPAPLAATGDGDGSLGWFGALAALGAAGAGIYAARRSRA